MCALTNQVMAFSLAKSYHYIGSEWKPFGFMCYVFTIYSYVDVRGHIKICNGI